MACSLQPQVRPFRTILEGGDATPKIQISADVLYLTTLLKDEQLSGYINATCLLTIDDANNSAMRGTVAVDATDVSSGVVDFDIDLLETMFFNWQNSFTDIWCETYILVDTQQLAEDYNITIPEEYYDMKGTVLKTRIIADGEIQESVIDDREPTVEEAAPEEGSPESLCDTPDIIEDSDDGFKKPSHDIIEDSDDGFKKPSIIEDQTLAVAKNAAKYLGQN